MKSTDVRAEADRLRPTHPAVADMLDAYANRLHQDEFGNCRPDEGIHDWPGANVMFLGARCSCGQRRVEEVNGVKLSDIIIETDATMPADAVDLKLPNGTRVRL